MKDLQEDFAKQKAILEVRAGQEEFLLKDTDTKGLLKGGAGKSL